MSQQFEQYTLTLGQQARTASAFLSTASTRQKNQALLHIRDALQSRRDQIMTENRKDLKAGQESGLTDAMLDRLTLNADRIDAMVEGLEQVAELPDPVGEISDMKYMPSGIQVGHMRVPLGVIAIIYESRPNVTIEAASLCLKSGNATILRGGSEAFYSNQVLAECINEGLRKSGCPENLVQVVDNTDRAIVGHLIKLEGLVDVVIPRGGKGLIERISGEARVPVLKHLDGICHTYVDKFADLEQALPIVVNAKTHRYGVCNAMETLLVHQDVAKDFLPKAALALQDIGVELRGCEQAQKLIDCLPATESDWSTEYLAPILSIRVLSGQQQAIDHINTYGSHHTDVILTRDYSRAMSFLRSVDSSSVMINASSRFADGFEYGLGAEIGISTDKLHVRGPVGLIGLTTQKYIVFGEGQIRQ